MKILGYFSGEMWEKSPFTLSDFIKQRKRWLQGILLVVHDRHLPIRVRIGLGKNQTFPIIQLIPLFFQVLLYIPGLHYH